MDKLRNRIKYYLLGLAIGCIFTYMIFGNRGCAWLPENRVKNMLAEKEIIIGDSIRFLMSCQGVNNSDIYRLLNEEGDVDFTLSNTHIEPKEYHFSGYKEQRDLTIRYALGDSLTEVIGFSFGDNNCKTTLSNDNKTTVKLPLEEVIEIIESQEFRILEKAACQMDCLSLSQDDVLLFHQGVKVYVSESKPRLQPNPYYILTGYNDKGEFSITYIIGENRTRISEITSTRDSCLCK